MKNFCDYLQCCKAMYLNTWTANLTLTSSLLLREGEGTKLWMPVIGNTTEMGYKTLSLSLSFVLGLFIRTSTSLYTAPMSYFYSLKIKLEINKEFGVNTLGDLQNIFHVTET